MTDEQVEPRPEPGPLAPFDAHVGPLDDPDDARYLDPSDPRRRAIEQQRGRPFLFDQEEQ
jgi:hypothetical protein